MVIGHASATIPPRLLSIVLYRNPDPFPPLPCLLCCDYKQGLREPLSLPGLQNASRALHPFTPFDFHYGDLWHTNRPVRSYSWSPLVQADADPPRHASEFTSPNNPHPPSNEYCDELSSDMLSGDASFLPMAHHISVATGLPLSNVSETLSFDDMIIHLSRVPLVAIRPSDLLQTLNAPSPTDPHSPAKPSPYESEICSGYGSGTSHAPSPAFPSPLTSRGSSAPPKRIPTKDKGSPIGRSKPRAAMRCSNYKGGTVRKVEGPPNLRAFPRRANRKPVTYVYDAPHPVSSPLLSSSGPDTDEEWKPDDSMTSEHEDDTSISNADYTYNDYKAARISHNCFPLIVPPPNVAITTSGRTERQRIRSFVQQREILNRAPTFASAEWVYHKGQFLCKAIVRQASKKGRAKWLPGCEPEVGTPCNQLLGTYQDWERHFSCSQWHQEPDTCRFCAKSLNVRSIERHLGEATTSPVWPCA